MTVTAATLRTFMLLDNVNSIPDSAFTQAVEDATVQVTISDDLLLKYKAANLLAITVDWYAVKKTGKVEFQTPNPDHFDKLYSNRLNQLVTADLDVNDLSTADLGRSDPKDDPNYYVR
jgi:hypothetical protein